MKTRWRWGAFVFALGGILGGTTAAPAPTGQLCDLGGYQLHARELGAGSPIVVLIAGAGDFSFDWSTIQGRTADFARVVSYDRAGTAWSDAGPVPRTFRQEAHELHVLLAKAGASPPYVLVGHSVGGLIARVFTAAFPADVAGVVLVDPTPEDGTLFYRGAMTRMIDAAQGRPIPPVQTMKSSPPPAISASDREEHLKLRQQFGAPTIRPPFDRLPEEAQRLRLWFMDQLPSPAGEDFMAEEMRALYCARRLEPQPLGARPLVVLVSTKPTPAPPGLNPEAWARLQRESVDRKTSLADLSSRGRVVRDDHSGHHLYLENPEIVIAAIREVVAAVRSR